MKHAIVILFIGLFSFLFGSRSHAEAPDRKVKPADMGRALRQMMLSTPPDKVPTKPNSDFPRIYGILMDWPIGEQTATVFSASTGDASLYTTSTFGIIGGQGHESVRNAARRFVTVADHYFDDSTETTEYPYPKDGHVRFYFLTYTGVRVIDTDLASIESGASKYRELFGLGQTVLTELRLITEKRQ